MVAMLEDTEHHGGQARYALTDTANAHVWGVCAEAEGLFADPPRSSYELFGWVPGGTETVGWVGTRVWLVPDDAAHGPWLLEDVESLGRHPGTDGLVLTALDDHEGPHEGYRSPVQVHDQRRRLGSCREFTRVLPGDTPAPSLVLRGLAPSDRLTRAWETGTRRTLDLKEAELEIRDDQGDLLGDRLLHPRIRGWSVSPHGRHLVDLALDGEFMPVPSFARPLWERWLAGPPDTPGAWAGLGIRERDAWLDLVRDRGCRREHGERPPGQVYRLDGRHITDEPGLYLALGEAVNGPGGYFGACLDALDDCLRGGFGHTSPATLHWKDATVAREHLSRRLTPQGKPYDLFADVLDVLGERGVRVLLK
ncbi:barstar family protein [Streptomyces sp. NPDC001046]|uniref:barstar family protein n=1 Tax=Streptomyces sp. NPDC001046 TaxID=3364543 RepID=UPI0036740DED